MDHKTQEIDKLVATAKWFWRSAHMDRELSADVFARGVYNAFGRPYCVMAAISKGEADTMVQAHNG